MAVNLSFIGGAGWQFFDNNGKVLSGGLLYTYIAGTTTPQTTYTSRSGTIANTNPIVLDSAGRTPEQIWSTEGILYKYVIADSNNIVIRTWDNIGGSEVSSELAQDLANSSNPAKGDALVGFRQSNSSGNLTGSVGRTVHTKLQEIVSVLDFGAKGDGVTDDSAAIQAAIDAFKPASGSTPVTGNAVYFPTGNYLINTSIKTYSGITLTGDGAPTILTAGPSLTTQIIEPAAVDFTGQYRFACIENLTFVTTGNVWAIKSSAALFLGNTIQNIQLRATYGISVAEPTYTQDSIISKVYSTGDINQIISLSGNFNHIEHINKEGGTGITTEPYIYIWSTTFDADENTLEKILLEGAGSANKVPIKFLNAGGNHITGYWLEASATNGYSLDLDASSVTLSDSHLSTFALSKIKLRNSASILINTFNSASEDLDWQPFFDADASSIVYVENMLGRRANNVYKIATPNNILINRYINSNFTQTLPTGYSAQSFPNYLSGQNVLINPSFEAGKYSWNLSSADVPTFVASDVSQGLMFQCSSTTGFQLTQPITISANQIGQPITLRAVAKITGAGFVIPLIAGNGDLSANRISADQGWQTLTTTFRPTSSGSLLFGLWWVGLSGATGTIYIDEMTVCFGEQGVINPSKFGSFELNQKTFTTATIVPATGTWKVGDRVFNSAPVVGQPKSWVCTVAGSPGTWVSEGNL